MGLVKKSRNLEFASARRRSAVLRIGIMRNVGSEAKASRLYFLFLNSLVLSISIMYSNECSMGCEASLKSLAAFTCVSACYHYLF